MVSPLLSPIFRNSIARYSMNDQQGKILPQREEERRVIMTQRHREDKTLSVTETIILMLSFANLVLMIVRMLNERNSGKQ